jgi:hypothetical protein
MVSGRSSHLRPRGLVALVLCGAAIGFTLPAIAKSFIQQERREPDVRLLPAPHVPRIETQSTQTGGAPTLGSTQPLKSTRRLKALTSAQLQRKTIKRSPHLITAPRVRRYLAPAPPASGAAPSPVTPTAKNAPKTSTKPATGGTPAPHER